MNTATMTPRDLQQFLSGTIAARLPILITGAPGIGKSDIVEQATAAAGATMIISHPVVSDPTDFKGLPFATVNTTTQQAEAHFLPFSDLQRIIDADKPTVFFLDDLGQAPPAVQAAAMQLILARRINGHRVSDQVTFIAATNRRQDRAGVAGILEPVKSRFCSIIELQPDLDSWCSWALKENPTTKAQNVPTELIAFIRFRPALLHDFKPSADLINTPSPRTIAQAGRLLALNFPDNILYPALSGSTGEGFAAEFIGFLKIYRNLPNPDSIILNPLNAAVPSDPATLYALSGALARKASKQNFDAIATYAERMPAEFSVVLVKDAITQKEELQNTRAFINWATKHADVLI